MKKKSLIRKIGRLIRNIIGAYMVVGGIAFIITGDIIAGICCALFGIVMTTLFTKFTTNHGMSIPAWGKVVLASTLLLGCSVGMTTPEEESKDDTVVNVDQSKEDIKEDQPKEDKQPVELVVDDQKPNKEETPKPIEKPKNPTLVKDNMFTGYKIIKVAGDNLSGVRKANVAVDIGYGSREYWAFTNKYGQLVKVYAKEIIPQRDDEPLNSNGRYYDDEAKVPGVESKYYDEGHVIADSLGGVSNAYNITPQESHLNRYGDQAYMEKVIRDAGGCTDFIAIITYPDTKTQIPSHYSYSYKINGRLIKDEFDNKNPESSKKPSKPSKKPTTNKKPTNSNQVVEKEPEGGRVWISRTGKKYHNKPNCGGMTEKTAKQVSLKEAKNRNLTPCKKCY